MSIIINDYKENNYKVLCSKYNNIIYNLQLNIYYVLNSIIIIYYNTFFMSNINQYKTYKNNINVIQILNQN